MRKFEWIDVIFGTIFLFIAALLVTALVSVVRVEVRQQQAENRKQQYWDDCVAKKSPGECYNVQVMED